MQVSKAFTQSSTFLPILNYNNVLTSDFIIRHNVTEKTTNYQWHNFLNVLVAHVKCVIPVKKKKTENSKKIIIIYPE